MPHQNWTLPTRILHLGLVFTVSAQLFISLIMEEPGEGYGGFGQFAFSAHEMIGLVALIIVVLHWTWSFFNGKPEGIQHLLPWNAAARQRILSELKGILNGNLPTMDKHGGLIGLIHGLGLLAVTGVAITGGILYLILPEIGEAGWIAKTYEEIHEFFAVLVWTYWIGHGGMAILHHVNGDKHIKKMFKIFPKIYPLRKRSIDSNSRT